MRRVPNHLQVKVIKWFDYLWLTQKCSDEEKAVSCLPGESRCSRSRADAKVPLDVEGRVSKSGDYLDVDSALTDARFIFATPVELNIDWNETGDKKRTM